MRKPWTSKHYFHDFVNDYFDVGFEFSTYTFKELLENLKKPANKESLEHDITKHIH